MHSLEDYHAIRDLELFLMDIRYSVSKPSQQTTSEGKTLGTLIYNIETGEMVFNPSESLRS